MVSKHFSASNLDINSAPLSYLQSVTDDIILKNYTRHACTSTVMEAIRILVMNYICSRCRRQFYQFSMDAAQGTRAVVLGQVRFSVDLFSMGMMSPV